MSGNGLSESEWDARLAAPSLHPEWIDRLAGMIECVKRGCQRQGARHGGIDGERTADRTCIHAMHIYVHMQCTQHVMPPWFVFVFN